MTRPNLPTSRWPHLPPSRAFCGAALVAGVVVPLCAALLIAQAPRRATLSPLEAAMGAETFARYNLALDTLSELEREAVIARLELGCNYQEIALLVDKPTQDAARMAVTRAIAKVAELMSATEAT